jgi:hypothetical protein
VIFIVPGVGAAVIGIGSAFETCFVAVVNAGYSGEEKLKINQ